MKPLRRMFQFIKPYARPSLLAILFLVGMVIANLAIPRLTQRLIDQGIFNRNMDIILGTALIMLGASVLSTLFSIVNTFLSAHVAQNVGADIRSQLVRKVQTLSFGNLDRFRTGELLVRSTSDINRVQMIVMRFLRMLVRLPLWLLGSASMLVITSRQLALVMLCLMPVLLVIIWLFTTRSQGLFTKVQQKLDRLNTVLQENLAGVRVVKAFVRSDHEKARFDQANAELTGQTISVMQFLAILMPTMRLILNTGIVAVIWVGGKQMSAGDLTTGQLVASINYLISAMVPLGIMGSVIGPLSAAAASAQRIFDVLDSVPEVQNRSNARSLDEFTGRIRFEQVSFSYHHDGSEPVLTDINLMVEPGQTVAILGATGAGKSSLVHLIPRFYDVSEGRIMLDDIDIRDLSLEFLRAQIGMVFQDVVLFNGTIRDNIRYGRPEATEEDIANAAQITQAHDFITAFPQGYDTIVGQRGITLSGGQKQRISIARALLVRPRILILDDSTSSVDVETEANIQTALTALMRTRKMTSFVVAQRISTVLNADNIVLLDQGHVTAVGTHADLIRSSQIYREIYDSQLGTGNPERRNAA